MQELWAPLCRTSDRTESVNYLCKCLATPFNFWTGFNRPLIHADGSGMVPAGVTFFSSSLASAALFVLRRDPSLFASAHSSGLSGCARTTLMIMYPNRSLSICFQDHLLSFVFVCIFFLVWGNVFKFCFFTLSWYFRGSVHKGYFISADWTNFNYRKHKYLSLEPMGFLRTSKDPKKLYNMHRQQIAAENLKRKWCLIKIFCLKLLT